MNQRAQIFLSYAGDDAFEASLLQSSIEAILRDADVLVWTYERDQPRDERNIGGSLRERVRNSAAAIVLVSQFTLESGATQWTELAYADAFSVPTFILLHHLTFDQVKRSEKGVPPLVLEGQCTTAVNWRSLESDLRRCCVQLGIGGDRGLQNLTTGPSFLEGPR